MSRVLVDFVISRLYCRSFLRFSTDPPWLCNICYPHLAEFSKIVSHFHTWYEQGFGTFEKEIGKPQGKNNLRYSSTKAGLVSITFLMRCKAIRHTKNETNKKKRNHFDELAKDLFLSYFFSPVSNTVWRVNASFVNYLRFCSVRLLNGVVLCTTLIIEYPPAQSSFGN